MNRTWFKWYRDWNCLKLSQQTFKSQQERKREREERVVHKTGCLDLEKVRDKITASHDTDEEQSKGTGREQYRGTGE